MATVSTVTKTTGASQFSAKGKKELEDIRSELKTAVAKDKEISVAILDKINSLKTPHTHSYVDVLTTYDNVSKTKDTDPFPIDPNVIYWVSIRGSFTGGAASIGNMEGLGGFGYNNGNAPVHGTSSAAIGSNMVAPQLVGGAAVATGGLIANLNTCLTDFLFCMSLEGLPTTISSWLKNRTDNPNVSIDLELVAGGVTHYKGKLKNENSYNKPKNKMDFCILRKSSAPGSAINDIGIALNRCNGKKTDFTITVWS